MLTRGFKENVLLFARVGIVILIALALGMTNTVYAAAPASPRIEGEATTPYQSSLAQALAARQAAGLPVPSSVTFDVKRTDGEVRAAGAGIMSTAATAPTVSVVATTTIEFANPQQAGYEAWPALVVEDNLPEEFSGTVMAGDYTETYREKIAEQLPGVWETYEFGQEPRVYTTTETINITYPAETLADASTLAADVTTSEDVLMGFTYSGPHIDYTIGDELEICLFGLCGTVYSFKAGFEMDWAMGLRLPARATLTGPGQMVQGNPYDFTTSLEPLDWSAEQYSASGVAPENGNEFALRLYFFAGVRAEIIGIDVCPSCYAELNFDESSSFATPFGSDAEFPIPSATIPIYTIDISALYFGLGLKIDPHLTSTKITADWSAVSGSDCSGSGTVTYSAPGEPVTFGPVTACNNGPSDLAQVKLDNFRYYFNEFVINLLAYLDFKVFGYGVWNPTINIASFDLSPITGGLNLGDHVQCNWAFSCSEVGPGNELLISIPVTDETPPVTSIALAGTEGTSGWYVSDVTVTLSAEDGPPGCGAGVAYTEYSLDNTTWTTYSGPFTLTTEGANTLYYRSADEEGNVEEAGLSTIKIDKTPPVITGAPTTAANGYGWYNSDVVVHFEATDAVSGVASVTPDQTLSAEGADQSVSGTAVDVAGNSASTTVAGINIDKTQPAVTITSPTATVYDNTASFNVDWSVTDDLSGVASEIGTLDGMAVANGQLINLLIVAAGEHALVVDGTDKADNTASASVAFQVNVDAKGLLASLDYMCSMGWIDRCHCKSLRVKLVAAIAAIDRGRYNAAENILEAFIHELEALAHHHHVTQQAFQVLKTDAEYVIDGLPIPEHHGHWYWHKHFLLIRHHD